jgi:diguanylate cyclase (GGDEF)-like protein
MLDPLTNLPLAKRFSYGLNEEWRRACRNQVPVSLLVIDIDNFKLFNQQYGYALGNDAVVQVATICKGELKRSADTVARLGGGSFGLMLPNTNLPGAIKIAQIINEAAKVLSLPVPNSAHSASLTVSVGIVSIIPAIEDLLDDGERAIDTFINEAYEKLHIAQSTGKNKICS